MSAQVSKMPQRSSNAVGGAKAIYERMRALIVWLGLAELAWIGYWLLTSGEHTATFVAIVIGWIVAMLGWLGVVTYAATRGFFLKHSWALSNLIGVGMW